MSDINWKRVKPLDLKDALAWCTRYAKAKHNRSVDQIADLMGVKKWTLYKWIEEADLPLRLLKSFEHACGIDYVSRWQVESNGKLIIEVAIGKKCGPRDINDLQKAYTDTVSKLLGFYDDLADVETTLAAMQTALEQTSWHRSNVEKYRQPELPFDEE